MSVSQNVLIQVQTYQKAQMAWLLNKFVVFNIANKKFRDFQNMTAQLGTSVSWELAPRLTSQASLVVSTQNIVQRLQTMTVSQTQSAAVPMDAFQIVYNDLDTYMRLYGEGASKQLGSAIEADVLKQAISGVTVLNSQASNNGSIVDTTSGPFRFYGDGVTPLNSFPQLAQSVANFEDFGASNIDPCGVVPSTAIPGIVSNQAGKFTPTVNDELFRKWDIGSYPTPEYRWYASNLLPIHYSGTVGNETAGGNVLTLVSTNDITGQNITQLTFSGATANDPNAIKYGDRFQFNWGVSGKPNLYYRHWIGNTQVSQQPVQFRATANAVADGSGNVTVSIYPTLQSVPGQFWNLSTSLQAGMKVTVLPDHMAGLLMSGDALYLAMPKLPDWEPYPTVVTQDEDTGMSIRNYWGASGLGTNVKQYVWDCIWASSLVAENSMALIFPVGQGLPSS